MDEMHLLLSLPPHQEDADAARAAPCLERAASELRVRAKGILPEIWWVDSDRAKLEACAEEMRASGYSVQALPASRFLAIPWGEQVDDFSVTDEGMSFELDETELTLPFTTPLFVVSCRPKLTEGPMRPDGFLGALKRGRKLAQSRALGRQVGGITGALIRGHGAARFASERLKDQTKAARERKKNPEQLAFIDLYFMCEGTPRRIVIVEGTVDYRPLGAAMKMISRENSQVLLSMFNGMYQHTKLNQVLENVPYKPSTVCGLNLQFALERMSSDMKEIDSYDLGSRLLAMLQWEDLNQQQVAPENVVQNESPLPPAPSSRGRKARFTFE